jgi:hypothetical protein
MGLTRDHHAFLHLGYYLLERLHIKQLEDNYFFSFKKSKRHGKEDHFDLLMQANTHRREVQKSSSSEYNSMRP